MSRRTPVVLITAFVAALLPLVDNYAFYHPDEQYYTDGAMEMVRSGEWITPRDAEGVPRLQKPIVAYWLVGASYVLFGVSPAASRLPFLLAGCAVLALTYVAARELTGERRAGLFAMLILLSQPQFILASLRSLPDIVLTLGLTVSAFGFLSVIVGGQRSRLFLLAAYGGAALGFLSDGLLALLFVLLVLTFVLLDRQRRVWLSILIEPVSIVLAVLAAGSWFAAVAFAQGTGAIQAFWRDQTELRFAMGVVQPAWLIPLFLLSYAVMFLPWSAAALSLSREGPQNPPKDAIARRARLFLFAWPLLVAVLFGWARDPEQRYLLPAVPFVAILLGGIFASTEAERTGRLFKQSMAVTLTIVLAVAVVVGWVEYQLDHPWTARVAPLYIATAAALGFAALARHWIAPATAQALAILLAVSLLGNTLQPIALPDEGEQLASRLEELRLLDGAPILFVGEFSTTARLRVAARGRVEVRRLQRFSSTAAVGAYCATVLPLRYAGDFAALGYRMHPGSHGYERLDMTALVAALFEGELLEYLATRRRDMVIAVPGVEGAEM